jgi:hypothetical protein
MTRRRLTKLEAAQRQLDTAATLFVAHGDALSAHTLAGAAEEILGKLVERAGGSNMMNRMEEALRQRRGASITIQSLSELVNDSRNQLKHANRPQEESFEYEDEDAVVMIFRALVNYQLATGALTELMEHALERLKSDYPWLFPPQN